MIWSLDQKLGRRNYKPKNYYYYYWNCKLNFLPYELNESVAKMMNNILDNKLDKFSVKTAIKWLSGCRALFWLRCYFWIFFGFCDLSDFRVCMNSVLKFFSYNHKNGRKKKCHVPLNSLCSNLVWKTSV